VKAITLLLALFTIIPAFAQFTDDFSDGDFTSNPTWSGDDVLFQVNGGELQSNSAVANTYYLSTTSTQATDAQWEFYFNLKFSTSGANFVDIYLMSDVANLTTPNDGYFVRVGGTPDEVSLYKMTAGSESLIIDGVDGIVNSSSNNPFYIRVTRDLSNLWTLEYDDGATGTYVTGGTVTDASFTSSAFFGIMIEQSGAAGPVMNHFFDSISVGSIPVDLTPPTVTSLVVLSDTTLDVYFDEPVDLVTAETEANYSANNGLGNPATAVRDGSDNTLVHLEWATQFGNGITNTLTVSNVEDLVGNAMVTQNEDFMYFVPAVAGPRDVVFNELFADPSPQVSLPPDAEFIELFNASSNTFDLAGWRVADVSQSSAFNSYVLAPGEHVILCAHSDTTDFFFYGNVLGIGSFPSLNNSGDNLTLLDNNGDVIDFVNYTDDWYRDDVKADGGWTLEQINPFNGCNDANNWIASNANVGGTPNGQNSVYNTTPDTQGPQLINALVNSSTELELVFNEVLDSTLALAGTYSITGGITVSGVQSIGPEYTRVILTLAPPMDTGVIYTITVSTVYDCSGNLIGTASAEFALPEQGDPGDVIINEVLSNPNTGGSDFVELYNNSNKILSLQNWTLAHYSSDTVSSFKIITTDPYLMFPGDYVTVTEDSAFIKLDYLNSVPGTFIETDIPSYSNDSGTVYLYTNLVQRSDKFSYTDDLHFALLNETKAVSLERIDFDRPTDDPTNWHSAAENIGFATPGATNSQYVPSSVPSDAVTIEPEVFSPDNDGYQDVVNISYLLDGPGYVGNVTIFDSHGRIVRLLLENELLATEGVISWDGINEQREKARIGVYVIYVEFFDVDGNISKIKKTCVLGTRL
jgi:hypothetical protein